MRDDAGSTFTILGPALARLLCFVPVAVEAGTVVEVVVDPVAPDEPGEVVGDEVGVVLPAPPPAEGGGGVVVVVVLGVVVAVVLGGAVVVAIAASEPPPRGVVFVARTADGEKLGCAPEPKTQAVTLPGGGRYVATPTVLYDQVVWPAVACQYDQ